MHLLALPVHSGFQFWYWGPLAVFKCPLVVTPGKAGQTGNMKNGSLGVPASRPLTPMVWSPLADESGVGDQLFLVHWGHKCPVTALLMFCTCHWLVDCL